MSPELVQDFVDRIEVIFFCRCCRKARKQTCRDAGLWQLSHEGARVEARRRRWGAVQNILDYPYQ
jgi:hypothetical protein